MTGRGEEEGAQGVARGWFVTVDGNAHVERHVRRRRRGGRVRGEKRGGARRTTAGWEGAEGWRGLRLVREFAGGCCIDRESERAKVSRGWLARRVALATLVVPHPSGVRPPVGPKTTPKRQPLPLAISLSPSLRLSPSLALSIHLFLYLSFSIIGLAIYTSYRAVRPIDMPDARVYAYVRDLFSPSHSRSSSIGLRARVFPFGNNWDRPCFLITLSEMMAVAFNPFRASLDDVLLRFMGQMRRVPRNNAKIMKEDNWDSSCFLITVESNKKIIFKYFGLNFSNYFFL